MKVLDDIILYFSRTKMQIVFKVMFYIFKKDANET